MKTPKIYINTINNGIITGEILSQCIYSTNKRAKNFRDKAREYREDERSRRFWNHYYYDKYDNAGKAAEQRDFYYSQKDKLLSVLNPICIHKECVGFEKRRIYDYEGDYKKFKRSSDIVWENCYFDDKQFREVWFYDILQKDKPIWRYYWYYKLGSYSFHSPIPKETVEQQISENTLEIIDIGRLITEGHDISDLLSNQFVTKVVHLIESNAYELRLDDI